MFPMETKALCRQEVSEFFRHEFGVLYIRNVGHIIAIVRLIPRM